MTFQRVAKRLIAASALAAFPVVALADDPVATGAVQIVPKSGSVEITALVTGHAPDPVQVEATLDIRRQDSNGNVQTRQSKTVAVSSGEMARVAVSGISLAAQGTLDIALSLRHEDVVVHQVEHSVRLDVPE